MRLLGLAVLLSPLLLVLLHPAGWGYAILAVQSCNRCLNSTYYLVTFADHGRSFAGEPLVIHG
jgi:hypothetical protein